MFVFQYKTELAKGGPAEKSWQAATPKQKEETRLDLNISVQYSRANRLLAELNERDMRPDLGNITPGKQGDIKSKKNELREINDWIKRLERQLAGAGKPARSIGIDPK